MGLTIRKGGMGVYNILICDDDRDIVSALEIYLRSEGYKTFAAYDGAEALKVVRENDIHLILMDVMMPNLDGIRATAKLREEWNIPILLLTAKSEDSDKILGLNIGADDYITKPFNPMEVMARVRSQLRRYTTLGAREGLGKEDGVLRCGGIALDDSAKSVTVDGDTVSLTPLEFNILRLLMQHPGQVFSSAQIYEAVWNDPAYGSENTVAVHIRHLREKIEIDPANPRYIKVVWGLGYKMEKAGK
jgi:DNA-binding response OmpR family regulator